MQERAVRAYKKASKSVDYNTLEFYGTGPDSEEYFTHTSRDLNSIYEQLNLRTAEQKVVRRLEWQSKVRDKILAECY